MRFTKLRLTGFKSFVDPTDLMIADGLTGVVGPNGCGKSNLLEALRWVMGENRPTAMRGGGMEDVIFAGAASRPARNFAEVALTIDNGERLAPAGFNESDQLEIVRRITRDVGSAYKTNGKDVRARDVQMLFADAATGAHSPALVRQGQISELINAKPKNRRRVLEDAAGIGGLYQRRHEAELKLKSTETNLARVEDVIEQLAGQLTQLARQARQAARYRAIGTELRQAEGMLLYRRWQEADLARAASEDTLRERTNEAARAESAAREAAKGRAKAEEQLPPLREEEAIAAAVLQRLIVQRDTLADQEQRARDTIETLTHRIEQLTKDIEREAGLNHDAGETIERLEWEARELEKASEGHDTRLADAAEGAREAAAVLQSREADLAQQTEDVARLAARHQSAHRFLADSRKMLERNESEVVRAREAVQAAKATLTTTTTAAAEATQAQADAQEMAERAEKVFDDAEAARSDTQAREADARAERSEAEGEANALRAEVQALARLLERDTAEGGQVMDRLQVEQGFEKALGAALADDLRAPEVGRDAATGWSALPPYDAEQPLPAGVTALNQHVSVPDVLVRRMGQIGLVDPDEGQALQPLLQPGQRLVSLEGDLWRWDGYRAGAEDAPSAAALRLEQLNRLETLKQEMARSEARVEGAQRAHNALTDRLAELTAADKAAREARREADTALTDATRALNRAEADRDMAQGKLESLGMAVRRYEDEATLARQQVSEAEAGVADLGDLEAARAQVEDIKLTVEAARMTMMSRRSAHDELRREGDARKARAQQVTKELSGWRHRLETAEKRAAELAERKEQTEQDLAEAANVPEDLAEQRTELAGAIAQAEARKAGASDALSAAEGALREAVAAEREAERKAGEARETRAAAAARADAARETMIVAAERIAEEQEVTPAQLLNRLDMDPDTLPTADRIEADVAR
ncbi:MAG: AAA family ATPase, partial [Paracoccaceae bacterium]|nr:AAA family ATPase [Paracoccaceae bacterium]